MTNDYGWARYYDLMFTGQDGDVRFYVEEAQKAGSPVLELGCGTGRILIPIAEAGVEIVGLDLSQAMLDTVRRKVERLKPEVRARIQLVEGDMREFSLGRRFPLITIPCRAFLEMLTVDDQSRTLARIREHLADDGRLILNFFDARHDIIARGIGESKPPMKKMKEAVDPVTGNRICFYGNAVYYPDRQMIEADWLFEELDAQGNVVRRYEDPIAFRWMYRYEMEHLLARCGFEVAALYGDFQRGPFRYGGEQVWVARKSDQSPVTSDQ